MIEDPKELEKEIFQPEDIKEEIDETAAQISNTIEHFLSSQISINKVSLVRFPPVVTLDQ